MSKNISTTPPVSCTLCPRRCGADRAAGQTGFCGAGGTLKAARAALHFWEEPCISGTRGSGTVFFSGCTLKCCFCQNYPISAEGLGKEITIEHLAEIFLDLQEQGAHNINLVTPGQWRPCVWGSSVNFRMRFRPRRPSGTDCPPVCRAARRAIRTAGLGSSPNSANGPATAPSRTSKSTAIR